MIGIFCENLCFHHKHTHLFRWWKEMLGCHPSVAYSSRDWLKHFSRGLTAHSLDFEVYFRFASSHRRRLFTTLAYIIFASLSETHLLTTTKPRLILFIIAWEREKEMQILITYIISQKKIFFVPILFYYFTMVTIFLLLRYLI